MKNEWNWMLDLKKKCKPATCPNCQCEIGEEE